MAEKKENFLKKENTGPHFVLDIGSQESFQNNLEKARAEGKLTDYKVEQESNWGDILLTFLPFVVFIGIWIYMMRRMSGGGAGGGGGQIFSIGRSKARLFDEKTDVKVTFKDGKSVQTQFTIERPIKNPNTGINMQYGILSILIIVGLSTYLLIRKKTKFPKHN